jgi:acyl-CoA reductase-like NAD-dependent aldehyde dehydrogenase
MLTRVKAERMLIGGSLVESVGQQWDDSVNPATEEVIGRAPSATKADVDKAVTAAEAAWPAWAAMSVNERSEILMILAKKLEEHAEELLRVEVADTGNTITPMRGDVRMAVETLKYFAGLGTKLKARAFPPPLRTCTSPSASHTASSGRSFLSTIPSCSRFRVQFPLLSRAMQSLLSRLRRAHYRL